MILSRPRMLRRFGEHSAAIQRIVNDFADRGRFRVDVHTIARLEMSNNSLGRYFQRDTAELRIAASLNMVNFQKPLIKRQMRIKGHDYFHPPTKKNSIIPLVYSDAVSQILDAASTQQAFVFGRKNPEKQTFGLTTAARGDQRNARLY